MVYGILFAVFIVRGLLPWIIVWATNPELGAIGAFTATFSNDMQIKLSIERSTPILMLGGGVFLIFLFLDWLFRSNKKLGLPWELFFLKRRNWFYFVIIAVLTLITLLAIKHNPRLLFSAAIGASIFFITDEVKKMVEVREEKLLYNKGIMSDISKMIYLEIIDTTFSIDGVLGAFAFTMSVPLIILGNGLGAIVVRQLTLGNIETIKKYIFLKNGAMYSIFCLGLVMILEGFKIQVPEFVSPLVTVMIIGFFFFKSVVYAKQSI